MSYGRKASGFQSGRQISGKGGMAVHSYRKHDRTVIRPGLGYPPPTRYGGSMIFTDASAVSITSSFVDSFSGTGVRMGAGAQA
jgi:hypothetical protein